MKQLQPIENLEDAKVGDRFMRWQRLGWKDHAYMSVVKVERLTRTQVVIDGMHYRKDNGRMVGEPRWSSCGLYAVDIERINAGKIILRRHRLANHVEWAKLSDDQINRIIAIVREGL